MAGTQCYLGCPLQVVESLKTMNDKLNAEVVEQVNDTQELVMLNNFARESNEYQFKKCLQERMSHIASWQWVLGDLNKRLGEAIDSLRYEHNALRVVIGRIEEELNVHCREATQPGALRPMCDSLEDAIIEECRFLCKQKKRFEKLVVTLEDQTALLDKVRKNIDNDIQNKQRALTVEESCAKINLESLPQGDFKKKTTRKESPVDCWERRCTSLKRKGLQALTNAVVTRQQVRGARVQLSITAQSYAAKVDSLLRRRLHTNKIKLQDLYWQRDEAARDYKALEEELTATEQNLLETMEQERVVEARLADRRQRPVGELTKDEVDRKLKDELGRLKDFIKQLRANHCRITSLQNHLTDCMARIGCCIEDLTFVINIDEDRILRRLGEEPVEGPNTPNASVVGLNTPAIGPSPSQVGQNPSLIAPNPSVASMSPSPIDPNPSRTGFTSTVDDFDRNIDSSNLTSEGTDPPPPVNGAEEPNSSPRSLDEPLESIREENEEEIIDYPFDD